MPRFGTSKETITIIFHSKAHKKSNSGTWGLVTRQGKDEGLLQSQFHLKVQEVGVLKVGDRMVL